MKIPFQEWGCMKRGAYKIPAAVGLKTYIPTPSPEKNALTRGRGEGWYIVSPWSFSLGWFWFPRDFSDPLHMAPKQGRTMTFRRPWSPALLVDNGKVTISVNPECKNRKEKCVPSA